VPSTFGRPFDNLPPILACRPASAADPMTLKDTIDEGID
jgi:hypothetical protein